MRALTAALAGIRSHWRLVLVTFFLQFCVAWLAAFGVFVASLSIAGGSEMFTRAANGDFAALIVVLIEEPAIIILPFVFGFIALLAYAALSWFMTAGLIGVFASRDASRPVLTFGRWGARRFFAFARLTGWALIPYVIIVLIIGMRIEGIGKPLAHALTTEAIAMAIIGRLLPGLVLLWIVWTLIDVARIHLVAAERASAWRAIGRAVRSLIRKPSLLAITLAGHLVSGLVLVVSIKLVGVGAGIGVFALRQLLLATRHAVHVGVIAAEVDRLEPTLPD